MTDCSFPSGYKMTGVLYAPTVNWTCGGKVDPATNRDDVPKRCGSGKVRCCTDGGPGSFGSDCALGADPLYCPPRMWCPKGSEGRALFQGGLTAAGCSPPSVNVCVYCPLGRFKAADTSAATDDAGRSVSSPSTMP